MSAVGITENAKGDNKKFEIWCNSREEVYIVQVSIRQKDGDVRSLLAVSRPPPTTTTTPSLYLFEGWVGACLKILTDIVCPFIFRRRQQRSKQRGSM